MINDIIIKKKKKNFLKRKNFSKYKLDKKQVLFFEENGFIIIKNAINSDRVTEFKKEIWDTIFKIPFSDYIQENIHYEFKDYDKDLTRKDIDYIKSFYPNIDKFGSMNLPPFFHLHNMWKCRQEPNIFVKFAQLLNNYKIWCTLDRVSVKLPGDGSSEFCHWDSDPWFWESQKYEPLQGILSLCDTHFFCCPGTHTINFSKKFQKYYEYLKPEGNNKRDYVSLKKGKPDPLNLCQSMKKFKLESGDLLIFSNRLLHESKQNLSNKIRYVQYISFEPARNDQNQQIYNNDNHKLTTKYEKNNITEIQDRIDSFNSGRNPLYLPSGCNMKIFSNNYLIFHSNLLNNFSNRFNKVLLKKYKYKSGKNKGKEIDVIYNYNSSKIITNDGNPFYTPFKLNKYGKKLLGLNKW